MIPPRKWRRQALRQFCYSKRIQENRWECCDTDFNDKAALGRHIHLKHESDLLFLENELANADKHADDNSQQDQEPLHRRRAHKGTSDPIALTCTCDRAQHRVILFYQYALIDDAPALAKEHLEKCGPNGWDLTGKVRISREGINATLAGTRDAIEQYMDWYTAEQRLDTRQKSSKSRAAFFKPSPGCRHVFADLSIKHVDEICPLGQPHITLDLVHDSSDHRLAPKDFYTMLAAHARALNESNASKNDDVVLIDTRNYYESKIGKFKGAITPQIRKFSSFPAYADRHRDEWNGKTIMTYCTGGIRCEKATAYLRSTLSDSTKIYMLDGGIHEYLNWLDDEQKGKIDDSLWQGRNYVFDARQSMGSETLGVIGACQTCAVPWDKYKKCDSPRCHLLVLLCDDCYDRAGRHCYCCDECPASSSEKDICQCERRRKQQELAS
ncbi:Rhodanese-like domain-containing protein [Gongronella butleri]|nr:Rhodanese-like domain-containing protein [Gongronella butleri]